MRKIIALILAVAVVLSMSLSVSAASLKDVLVGAGYPTQLNVTSEMSTMVKAFNEGTAKYAEERNVNVTSLPQTFNFRTVLDMSDVRTAIQTAYDVVKLREGGDDAFRNAQVSGNFDIVVNYSNNIALSDGDRSDYFSKFTKISSIFAGDGIQDTSASESGMNAVKISVKIKDGNNDYVTAGQLLDNAALLDDIEFIHDVKVLQRGLYKVNVSMNGTVIIDNDPSVKVTFTSTGRTAGLNVFKSSSSSDSGSSTGGTNNNPTIGAKEVKVDLRGNENISVKADANNKVKTADILSKVPAKPGFVVAGIYTDVGYLNKAGDEIDVSKTPNVYVRYVNITPPTTLDAKDHNSYIQGYPDGNIRPNDNVTRDEVSTMLYRLLEKTVKDNNETTENNFSDVPKDLWSNLYVSTLAKAGIIKGYENGKFDPEASITRAEFVTMIARVYGDKLPDAAKSKCEYTDIFGHWAEGYIRSVYDLCIVNGYSDGTFKPDQPITRAEAIAILNRVLVRYADDDAVTSGAKEWNDVSKSEWFYNDILEATNGHDFDRRADQWNEKHLDYK